MKNTWKQKLTKFWKGWGWSFLIALLVATSFRSAIADWNDVPTGSMKPTILEGDRIFVNKLAYDLKIPYTTRHIALWDNPQRGDIVVFFSPKDGKRLVKRVVGIPGDELAMLKNRLFLNGKPVQYETLDSESLFPEQPMAYRFYFERLNENAHPVMFNPTRPSLHTFAPITVPQNHYFMMGDNRDNSADSRFFGFVERSRIVGQATTVVFSLNYERHYLPRSNRFLHQLQ